MIPKFRAWKKTNCPEMFEDIRAIDFEKNIIRIGYKLSEYTTRIDEVSLDNVILLQSTGLKDINGKEIYEGDILKVFVLRDMGAIAKVIFKNGMFGIEDDMHGYGYDKGLYSLDQILSLRDAEIIGNKFQNKDLLEEE